MLDMLRSILQFLENGTEFLPHEIGVLKFLRKEANHSAHQSLFLVRIVEACG